MKEDALGERARKQGKSLRRQVTGAAIVGVVLLFVGIGALLPTSRLRYRLTIEVDTPQGVRTGSSVIEVAIERSLPFWGASGTRYRVFGEATAVDLPDGRMLLSMLHESMNASLPELAALQGRAVPAMWRDYQYPAGRGWWEMKIRRPVIEVDLVKAYGPRGRYYPEMVVLRPDDPRSVEGVEPGAFEAVLGKGLGLRRMTIEITRAPVTHALVDRVPWITGVSHRTMTTAQRGPLRSFVSPSSFVAER